MARNRGFRTQAPRKGTVLLAGAFWLLGVLDTLGAFILPNRLGIWLLVIAGLLLLLGSLVDGL